MSQVTRKQRQQELRAIEKKQEIIEASTSIEKTDELIFKEQKQRLRKQLNDVPAISIDANDAIVKPNRLQTRTDIKKQKKIDDILKDIAVLPEDKYLDEDTNLRILRNLSMHKQYDNLQLSPEQEERMQENKERFDTITSQLWFLIKELESKNVKEPGFGQVPSVTSKEKEKARSERHFFDVEEELKQTQKELDKAMKERNEKLEAEKHYSEHIEEKLENFKIEETPDGELTSVLKELDRLLQDDKAIVHDEIAQHEITGSIPPQDTMELLEILQELEEAKDQKSSTIDLTRPLKSTATEKRISGTIDNQIPKAVVDGDINKLTQEIQVDLEKQKAQQPAKVSTAQPEPVKKTIQQEKAVELPIKVEESVTSAGHVVLPEKLIVTPIDENTKTTMINENHRTIDLTQPAIDVREIKEKEAAAKAQEDKKAREAEVAKIAAAKKAKEVAIKAEEDKKASEISAQKAANNPTLETTKPINNNQVVNETIENKKELEKAAKEKQKQEEIKNAAIAKKQKQEELQRAEAAKKEQERVASLSTTEPVVDVKEEEQPTRARSKKNNKTNDNKVDVVQVEKLPQVKKDGGLQTGIMITLSIFLFLIIVLVAMLIFQYATKGKIFG